MDTPYAPPVLRHGDRVLVAHDPSWTDEMVGWVHSVNGQFTDIVGFPGGRSMLFEECLYHDDPAVTERPVLFEDANRGVFRLAESELEQREIIRELATQRTMLDELATQVATIQAPPQAVKNEFAPPAEPPKRGPGRPRKPKPELQEVE